VSGATILVLNGPNLNLLGVREPATYGRETLADIEDHCLESAAVLGVQVDFRQSNHEGQLVDCAADVPIVEVHLSNIHRREAYRHHSYVSSIADGVICGLGGHGYVLALEAVARLLTADEPQD
jgi:3-dehydroquinate dehydratase-2